MKALHILGLLWLVGCSQTDLSQRPFALNAPAPQVALSGEAFTVEIDVVCPAGWDALFTVAPSAGTPAPAGQVTDLFINTVSCLPDAPASVTRRTQVRMQIAADAVPGRLSIPVSASAESHTENVSVEIDIRAALRVAVAGNGRITAPGIDCPGDCVEGYAAGTEVLLTALPGDASSLAGFTGDVDCTDGSLRMDRQRSCGAVFNAGTAAAGWQPYADPVTVDAAQGLRLASSIVQRVPGASALVAFREQASVHVNQLQGPPGPGINFGRQLEINAGQALTGRPSIDAGAQGNAIYATWAEGPTLGSRDVRVKRLTGVPDWASVGGALDANVASDAHDPVLRVGVGGWPVVAWLEGGAPHIKRWDGSSWQIYGGQSRIGLEVFGTSRLRLALRPDGRPVLAFNASRAGGGIEAIVAEWTGSTWQAMGGSVAANATGEPIFIDVAVGADDVPIFVRSAPEQAFVTVGRFVGGSWNVQSLDGGDGNTAARVWDVALDAGHALSSQGVQSPMVAWIERGALPRAVVRRWSGSNWQAVGPAIAFVQLPEFVAIAAHDVRPAVLVTDQPLGLSGRIVQAWRHEP